MRVFPLTGLPRANSATSHAIIAVCALTAVGADGPAHKVGEHFDIASTFALLRTRSSADFG